MTGIEIARYREMIEVRQREIEKALGERAGEEQDLTWRALTEEAKLLREVRAELDQLENKNEGKEPNTEG